ncbi:MAG: S-methyl-5'-thioadenosine phosphorylase, partial [Zestosphaera sp.]
MLVKPPVTVDVGIIGGSGLYDPGMFRETREFKVYTPYGPPSDNVLVGSYGGRLVAF